MSAPEKSARECAAGDRDIVEAIESGSMPIAGEHLRRKLAVILASDVAGYSALISADEEGTVRRYAEISRLMHKLVSQQAGRVFNTAGDAILAEFDSAVNAVRCAIDVQEAVNALDGAEPGRGRLRLRIGIAIGDVIVADNGDLLGDGVNIAARLEGLAAPGGVCISRDVLNLVQSKIGLGFDDLGLQDLKNIAQPVHAYRVTPTGAAPQVLPARGATPAGWWPPSKMTLAAVVLGCVAMIAGGVVLGRRDRTTGVQAWEKFDPARVPLITRERREKIRAGYLNAGGRRALFISNDGDSTGMAVNRATDQDAATAAEEDCNRESSTRPGQRGCFLYAIGDRVVADPARFPVPPESEAPRRPIGQKFGVDDPPLLRMQQGNRLGRDYPLHGGPKAIAIGTRGEAVWGAWSHGVSDDEAVRRTLEFCGSRASSGGGGGGGGTGTGAGVGSAPSPCILYAVGDELVTRPPRTRRIIGVLVIATDKAIPAAERARLAQDYAAGDWQALARGRGGTWHAASGAVSEAAAAEAALTKCQAADTACQIYAIGRFLVAGEAG